MTLAADNNTDVKIDAEIGILGAGFGGIGAAIALKRAGFDDFLMIDSADDFGGSWRANTYPGVRADTPGLGYQFSFEPVLESKTLFPTGRELKGYIDYLVDKYDLRKQTLLNTRAVKAEFDEVNHVWRTTMDDGRVSVSRYSVFAGGIFTIPKYVDVPGLDTFTGHHFHTAEWDHGYDLRGKTVAVIGTGASGAQVIPEIAPDVAQLHVVQRTPAWIYPKPDLPLPGPVGYAIRKIPPIRFATRQAVNLTVEIFKTTGFIYFHRLSWFVNLGEKFLLGILKMQVPNPEIRAKLTPQYGLGCNFPPSSNNYWRTFMRPNVNLIVDGIDKFTPDGFTTNDGEQVKVDTIIFATGFKAFERGSMPSIEAYGLGGVELGEFFEHERFQAYQGTSIPRFPNAFTTTGPYAFNGYSWPQAIENAAAHMIRCLKEARKRDATYVEVTQEANDQYLELCLQRLDRSGIFTHRCVGVNGYFRDQHGDSPIARPTSTLSSWYMNRRFSFSNYIFKRVDNVVVDDRRERSKKSDQTQIEIVG